MPASTSILRQEAEANVSRTKALIIRSRELRAITEELVAESRRLLVGRSAEFILKFPRGNP